MEIDFKEPNLYLYKLLNSKGHENELREYLKEKININIYTKAIEKGILEYNKDDLDIMKKLIEEKLKEFEEKKREDEDNEAFVFGIDKQICAFYAQIFDLDNFEACVKKLMDKDCSSSLKMDILMCKIRISIITENRTALISSFDEAENIFDTSCDWDQKNRFKIYLGLFSLMKADFEEAANQFSECLASFDTSELLSFDDLILYLVFSALLSFNRCDLKKMIIDNSEVRKCGNILSLAEALYDCRYQTILSELLKFVELTGNNLFLSHYQDHFCKSMKIKIYAQLLLSYQSLHLEKMAQIFDVTPNSIEEDLRNFINEGRLNCVIDRIDRVVKVREAREDDHLFQSLQKGEKLLRNIKKSID